MSNPWAEADALKNKAIQTFNWLRSSVYEVDKRAGNSVKQLTDGTGRYWLRFDGVEHSSSNAQELFAKFTEHHERVTKREAAK